MRFHMKSDWLPLVEADRFRARFVVCLRVPWRHPAHSPFLHLLHDVGRPCATARTELAKSPHSRGLEYKSLPRAILVPVEMSFSVLSCRETNQLHRSECVFVVSCESERLTTLIPIDIFGAGQKETFKSKPCYVH